MLADAATAGLRLHAPPVDEQPCACGRSRDALVVLRDDRVAVARLRLRRSNVGDPPCSLKVDQYQSTVSPSFSVAWSAPTGGETPLTL